nr:MAG TPA: hypothetical protein [Bacteriophage sp.]
MIQLPFGFHRFLVADAIITQQRSVCNSVE